MNPPSDLNSNVPSYKVRVSDTRDNQGAGQDIPGSPTGTIAARTGTDVAEWNATYSPIVRHENV